MRYIRKTVTILFAVTFVIWGISIFISHKNVDRENPVITSDSDRIQVSVNDDEKKLKKGLKAVDNKDGDITDQIMIGKQSKFVEKGISNVQFLVFDSSNNVGSITKEIEYTDYTSPTFVLTHPLVYTLYDKVTVLDRITAMDCIEGDISDKMKIVSSDVNENRPGVYTIGVQVSNKFGDMVSVQLPVNIVEQEEDVPYLVLDSYYVTVKKGEDFYPGTYLEHATLSDGSEIGRSDISIENYVDTTVEGTYQVIFSYLDTVGRKGHTNLIVNVIE